MTVQELMPSCKAHMSFKYNGQGQVRACTMGQPDSLNTLP